MTNYGWLPGLHEEEPGLISALRLEILSPGISPDPFIVIPGSLIYAAEMDKSNDPPCCLRRTTFFVLRVLDLVKLRRDFFTIFYHSMRFIFAGG